MKQAAAGGVPLEHWCGRCKQFLPFDAFHKNAASKTGLRTSAAPAVARPTMSLSASEEQLKPIAGHSVLFEISRGPDGRIRVGVFDRIATLGFKKKDGLEAEFSRATLSEMARNWRRRGDLLSMCYDHQSAHSSENGQPAPALAFYDALAVVTDEQVVAFEKLAACQAAPPDVNTLKPLVAKYASDDNPNPSPDGLWAHRCEITEIGEQLLPGFRYLSPMFTTSGADERVIRLDTSYTTLRRRTFRSRAAAKSNLIV